MKTRLIVAGTVALCVCGSAWAVPIDCLLTNGQFDDGLNGWTYDSIGSGSAEFNSPLGVPTVGPVAGNFNPGMSPAGDPAMVRSIDGEIVGSNWIYQTFATPLGAPLQLVGLYAGGVGNPTSFPGTATWEVVLYPGAYDKPRTAGTADSVAMTASTSPNGMVFGWTQVDYPFVATDTSYTLALKWTGSTTAGSGYSMGAYFDGFCVAPEPASLALLGLALPLLRRRRRA